MIVLRALLIGLCSLSLTCTAHAAPAKVKPADEAKSVTTITKDLLNQLRNAVLSYRSVYKEIEANPTRYEAIRSTILSDRDAALEVKNTRAQELFTAIQNRTEIETLQLISPHIVPFNEGLLALVDFYKGQACAPSGNPALCIGGAWSRRRLGVGNIIDSQAADLQAIEEFGDSSAFTIDSIVQDLETLGSDQPHALLEFGLAHYRAKTAEILQRLLDTTADLAPMFDGLSLENQPNQRYLPCIIGSSIPLSDFKSQLIDIKTTAALLSNNRQAFAQYMEGMNHYYDGFGGNPGVISHWNGCIGSNQLQINTLQVSLNQARAAGDTQSAKNFDSVIHTLSQEIEKLRAEEKILQHRRNQVNAISNTHSLLVDPENEFDITWVAGVAAHVDDLISGMPVYPNMLRAMRALVIAAQPQLSLLASPVSEADMKDKALQLASYYDTLLGARGYNRLKTELSFGGRTVFPNLAQAIRIGESALTANIQTFQDILAQTAAFNLAEQLGLPAQLTAAHQAVATAQSNFNNAAALVAELEFAVTEHDTSMQIIAQTAATLEGILGVARFNPLYSDMASNFTASLKSDKRYKGAGAKIQSGVKSYLKKFNALTPANVKGITCRKKKGVCASTLVRKAAARRNELVAAIGTELDTLGRAYLSGQNISSLMATILTRQALVLSREH